MLKPFSLFLSLLLLAGCVSISVPGNRPLGEGSVTYRLADFRDAINQRDTQVVLTFSGGGTRAAALSYGVLKALRDIPAGEVGISLLDDVVVISSVSGGSFTAAYYGLFGQRIFEDFEPRFLRRNVQARLAGQMVGPSHWFSGLTRTDLAVEYLDRELFDGKTFADLRNSGGPLVLINASDLGYAVRMSFLQGYFDLLCSDLGAFPVARAVAASSAVPLVFNSVVLEIFDNCHSAEITLLPERAPKPADSAYYRQVIETLNAYRTDAYSRRFSHLFDGGITDNLGLRALVDLIEIEGGGGASFGDLPGFKQPRRLVIIAVDASTRPIPEMSRTPEQPTLAETINALSALQMHRYNTDSIDLMQRELDEWEQKQRASGHAADAYFVKVRLSDVDDATRRGFLNQIPTSLHLSNEQVDVLIESAIHLLDQNPEFQRLLDDIDRQGK